ncbi:DNA polymerase III subunit gamma/tau [Neisseria sp. HMSC064E01]|uniref:DNA polymerase III subunit gamma/tau n=1 Tax=Neisseria sp. HMSC064E01 TaxID=1715052 RepID=UPI0008A413B1|nr:DNA polymerase III subunit gamma/tau [Neisseria sp. HMSC064E01]OFN80794.1 DNA polymerase III subunit gamma/tau [Neisseria sp. HMSC064E01]
MAYQVLARKWRPKTFADLVGQEHVVKALRNALDEGRLHHAYLLTGTRGVGKTTIARILAKSLNCENAQHGEPCGVCQSCTQIDTGRYVDLLEIDAASNTGIDNIREVLENAQYAPTAGKYKVYIIDEVHMLSKSAFNAMLKTLEEPPEHVKFILATTDPHKVPITVLSRCLQFVLRNMTSQQVADHLAHVLNNENIAYEPAALQLLGRAAAGSMRDALSLLDQAIAMGSGSVAEQDVRQMIGAVDKQYLYELLAGIVNQDGEALLAKAQEMAARAIGFDSALSELAMLLQRLALIQAVPSALAHDDPERETLLQLSQALSGEQIQLYYQCAIHGKQDLSLAPDEYAGFVMTLLRMLAFAPLAADAHDVGGHIENTELHSAETGVHTAKKPLQLPQSEAAKPPVQTTSTPATSSENKVAEPVTTQENNDVPPWEDAPSEAETVTDTPVQAEAESVQTTSDAAEANLPSANEAEMPFQTTPQAETSSENQVSDYGAANNETDVFLNDTSFENPDNTNPIQTTPIAEAAEAEAFAHEAPVAPFYDYGSPEHDYPVADSADMPPPPDWEHAVPADTAEAESEAEEDSDDEDGTQFAPLPEFSTENWAAIVRHFARKLGAAQMLAQHAAWTHYDAGSHLMMLSMTDEARATANKERLDKIKNTLAEAYGIQLKLQTEPWRDDAGWETPTMRRQRLQLEGRQQAQDLLEADETARQVLKVFEAQWQPDSLELAEQAE